MWFHATLPTHPPKSTDLFVYTSSHSILSNHKHKWQETATFQHSNQHALDRQ